MRCVLLTLGLLAVGGPLALTALGWVWNKIDGPARWGTRQWTSECYHRDGATVERSR